MRLEELVMPESGSEPPVIAVPIANDPDIIGAIAETMEKGIAKFILIGCRDSITALADECSVGVGDAEFIHADDEKEACAIAAQAVKDNRAQILMKGLTQSSTYLKAILDKKYNFIPESNLLSHIGLFDIPAYHKLLIVTDAGINIEPDLDDKIKIVKNAISFARRIGITSPRVACACAVEKINPKIISTVHAGELKKMSDAGAFGNALVDGPFGLDIAISKDAAETKGVTSEVAGDPDIILLPQIDAANIFYKTLTKLSGASTASVVAGIEHPVVILPSRSDSEESRRLSIALAARMIRS